MKELYTDFEIEMFRDYRRSYNGGKMMPLGGGYDEKQFKKDYWASGTDLDIDLWMAEVFFKNLVSPGLLHSPEDREEKYDRYDDSIFAMREENKEEMERLFDEHFEYMLGQIEKGETHTPLYYWWFHGPTNDRKYREGRSVTKEEGEE